MPDVKHPFCQHPKCGAKMQRLYKRVNRKFVPCAWMCTDCGQMQKDNIIPDLLKYIEIKLI